MAKTERSTPLTQTVEQAAEAVEAAGLRVYRAKDGARVYDPARKGAYALLDGGYRNPATGWESYVSVIEGNGAKCSGAFHARLRKIVEAQRAEIEGR